MRSENSIGSVAVFFEKAIGAIIKNHNDVQDKRTRNHSAKDLRELHTKIEEAIKEFPHMPEDYFRQCRTKYKLETKKADAYDILKSRDPLEYSRRRAEQIQDRERRFDVENAKVVNSYIPSEKERRLKKLRNACTRLESLEESRGGSSIGDVIICEMEILKAEKRVRDLYKFLKSACEF